MLIIRMLDKPLVLYFCQEEMVMSKAGISNDTEQTLDYEKDLRFVEYMKQRLDKAIKDREAGRLVDADVVFAGIRDKYGW